IGAGAVPPLCRRPHHHRQRVRLHRLQGAHGVPELRRAVRPLQGAVTLMSTAGVVFHPLRVAEVRPETDEAVSVTFEVPQHHADAYRYLPGQHVTLKARIDGEDVRRSYSICANANTGTLRVGIKRLHGGAFSTWATTDLAPGDVVEVMPP